MLTIQLNPCPTVTQDWAHQAEAFERSKDAPAYALFMEPRTGKTRIILKTAARLYRNKQVDRLLIVAWPSGVHRNWVTDECPAHLDVPWAAFYWKQTKVKRKYYQEQLDQLLSFQDGLAVLAINAEALPSEECRKAIGKFVRSGRYGAMATGDETIFMQTPGKKRSRIMGNIAKIPEVKYRRILDGTPISNQGPLGLYTQVGFLDKSILGFNDFTSFKAHYAILEEQGDYVHRQGLEQGRQVARDNALTDKDLLPDAIEAFASRYAARIGKSWMGLKRNEKGEVEYRNLDELNERLAPYSYRCRFRDVFKDVPEPIYQPIYIELTQEQRRVYDELREEYATQLRTGAEVEARMVLVRYTRLQQVTSNYWPAIKGNQVCRACDGIPDPDAPCSECDDLGVIIIESDLTRIDPDHSPRIEALERLLRKGDQWIIWAKFDQEIADVKSLAERLNISYGQYDGKVSADAKAQAKDDFQAGKIDLFIAKGSSAGRGIPLWKARGAVFLSHIFSLSTYQQMLMRTEIAHRRVAAEMVHFIAEDTIDDQYIIPSLRQNMDLAARIMGDPRRAWL